MPVVGVSFYKNKIQIVIYMAEKNENALKEQTKEMYDNTIAEMEKRGASQQEIEIVKKAKEQTMASYDEDNNVIPFNAISAKTATILTPPRYGTLYDVFSSIQNIEPLRNNLFIVHIGEMPIYVCKSVYYNSKRKEINIAAIECREFSSNDYFEQNKKFKELRIEYLDAVGKTVKNEIFSKIKVKAVQTGCLSYEDNGRPIEVYITLTYKNKNVSTAD